MPHQLTSEEVAVLLRVERALRDQQLEEMNARLDHAEKIIIRAYRAQLAAIDRESDEVAAEIEKITNDPAFSVIADRLTRHLARLRAMGKMPEAPTTPTT